MRSASPAPALHGADKALLNAARANLYVLMAFVVLAGGGSSGWASALSHQLMILGLLLVVLSLQWDARKRVQRTPLDKPLLAAVALAAVSTLFSSSTAVSLRALWELALPLAVFFLAIQTTRNREDLRGLVYLVLLLGGAVALAGLTGLSPHGNPLWRDNAVRQHGRLTSVFFNPDHAGAFLEMAIPLCLGFLFTGIPRAKKTGAVFLLLAMLSALVLTLSRGAWISALAGLCFFWAVSLKRGLSRLQKSLLFASIAGVLFLALLAASTPATLRILSFEEATEMPGFRIRARVWAAALGMFADNPWTGTGPGTFGIMFAQYQPGFAFRFLEAHNDYIDFLAETGIFFVPIL
ncbi:MAG: O-antigen ligase family protein, partial [Deltaproteobacteria bacterium]|nr:O-antigen ligase family protein [Deltaproteobacteria bacterium]